MSNSTKGKTLPNGTTDVCQPRQISVDSFSFDLRDYIQCNIIELIYVAKELQAH